MSNGVGRGPPREARVVRERDGVGVGAHRGGALRVERGPGAEGTGAELQTGPRGADRTDGSYCEIEPGEDRAAERSLEWGYHLGSELAVWFRTVTSSFCSWSVSRKLGRIQRGRLELWS